MPPGLIIFDRGFNNRQSCKRLVKQGHHVLCRARSKRVFFSLPTEADQPQRGRRRIDGNRVDFRHGRDETVFIEALGHSVASASRGVRSKSCPEPIHRVVRRTKVRKSKPSRYCLVYTTDLSVSVERIIPLYKTRWTVETGMHDAKDSFGVDHDQVRSETAIERHVPLSVVATSVIQRLTLPAFLETKKQKHPDLRTA